MPAAAPAHRFIDPGVLQRLASLELRARTVVDGFLTGLHRSPRRGFSVEFAEYRQYLPGDDLAMIDWKVFARSDRHVVRKYEEETSLECHLLVDVSRSMTYGSGTIRKIDCATTLAASLAYLLTRQRDSVGLIAFDADVVSRLPPSARPGQWRRLLVALEGLPAGGRSDLAAPIDALARAMRRRGLVVLISDLIDEPAPAIRALSRLKVRGTDVIVFQVLDPAERTFSFVEPGRFQDLETGAEIVAAPDRARAGYVAAIDAHVDAYRQGLAAAGIDYVLVDSAAPFDGPLGAFLDARGKRL